MTTIRSKQPKHGTLAEAFALLESSPLRSTGPRRAILKALVKGHGPHTVDELYMKLRGEALDRATIYRCLAAFERIGFVRRCEFGDGSSRFEFQCEHEHHHHITCTVCRVTEVVEDCSVTIAEKRVKDRGYEKISHTLEFFGICKKCSH